MADFVSSLTGVQMDSALMDMAEHNSEAWAVGERNGIPVGSDDVTYQNNAQYYAQQAQSIAPASVTEAVRWDIAQTALTDANKAQARSNIDAGKNGAWSNRNLLDNWYFVGGGSQLGDGVFPINQRGQSSYTGGYGIDRWRCWQTSTVTLSASGLTFATGTNGDGLFQYFTQGFYESLYGKTVTVSAIINGQLYSVTGTASADCWIATQFDGDNYIGYICNGNEANFRISLNGGGRSATIQAVKLELGTVSTLANDPPPDFGEELRKCQRYLFIRDYAQNDVIANGLTNNLTMFLSASMRSGGSPTMTFTATPYVIGNGVISTPTSVNLASVNGNQVQIYAPTTESHNAQAIVLYAGSATRMTIANEL